MLYQPFPMLGTSRAQIWRHSPAYLRPRHFHAEPELNLVVRGTATLGIGRRELRLRAGQLCVLLPGQDHQLLAASSDLELFVMAVTPELCERVLGERAATVFAGASPLLALEARDLARFTDACRAPFLALDAQSRERLVADLWLRARRAGREAGAHPATRRSLDELLSDLASGRMALSRRARAHASEVSRLFRRDLGLTLTEYRRRLRVLRFIECVDGGASSFLAAALQAGFGSYSQCHRDFLRLLEISPRRFFRREVRELMASATLTPA